MISISFLRTFDVRGINLCALSSTHPSAAFVMIRTVPLFFDNSNNLAAYSSISYIFLLIAAGNGLVLG